ncbi:MAG: Ig-like domain-containing protein, partial [Gemmatimonadaceae bacterium]|nr:Ig-like domain-containing protein [Gemmatimonadaceae bacterium]
MSVSPASATIEVGESSVLTAATADAKGKQLTGQAITWTSANSTIVTVSQTGQVTGVVAGGPIEVTASSGGRSAVARVTVRLAAAATVTLAPAVVSVPKDTTTQLTAVVRDARGATLTGRTVTWTTSAAGVATVSSGGLVAGIAVGLATITATSESKSATAGVTVTPPPVASIAIAPTSTSVGIGATSQLSATLRDKRGNALTGRALIWTSDAIAVATVSQIGLVTGVATGSALITATSEGVANTATVTVTSTTITVSPTSETLRASGHPSFGWRRQLSWVVIGVPGVSQAVRLTSRNPTVATVSASGLVNAARAGRTQIVVTSVVDPTKEAIYDVTVLDGCTQTVEVPLGYGMADTVMCILK